jgi:uncharacterized membrane-anchored protein
MDKKKVIGLLGLCIPLAALVLWVAGIEARYLGAQKVLIAAEGYDPRDLLSGHYLHLRLNFDKTDCAQFSDNICPTERFDHVYRFYLEEHAAQELDRDLWRSNLDLKLEFSYLENQPPLIRELYINGFKWQDWIKQEKD